MIRNGSIKRILATIIGVFSILSVSLAFPLTTLAQSTLVVCGTGGTIGGGQNDATGCQACHLFQLIDRLIKFLILLAIPIATLLFAYAGFLYFSSGVSAHSEATAIFKDVLFGFVIALCGYLIVDTIIKTLVNGSFVGPSWNTVQCANRSLASVAGPGLQFGDVQNLGGLVVGDSAPSPIEAGEIGSGDCSPSKLEGAWGNNAARMSCIVNGESTCRTGIASTVDIGSDGQAVSYGLYQINLSANPVQCPGQPALNCPQAYTGVYTGDNHNVRVKGDSGSQALFQQCRDAASRADCATYTAQQIFAQGGFSRWGADARNNCGQLQYGNM